MWDPFVPADSALCPRRDLALRGFSVTDGDGDGGRTPGLVSFLLADQTVDFTGLQGPKHVGFRACRWYDAGAPEASGGLPQRDLSLFGAMTDPAGVDPVTGSPTGPAAPGNPVVLCSVGPYLRFDPGDRLHATIVLAIQPESSAQAATFPSDEAQFRAGTISAPTMFLRHPSVQHAYRIARIAEGDLAPPPPGRTGPDASGRETRLIAPPGTVFNIADCRDIEFGQSREVPDDAYTWFDFDCDFCTGVAGWFSRPWVIPFTTVGIGPTPSRPSVALRAPAPNPSSSVTRIEVVAPPGSLVRARVLDARGRMVSRLLPVRLGKGSGLLTWDGTDDRGIETPAGVYWIEADASGDRTTCRIVRIR